VSARLVVGVGCSLGCPPEELLGLVDDALAGTPGRVTALATVDRRADEPCVLAAAATHDVPLRTYSAERLARIRVPNPSATVAAHVGTPSVAEAAALASAGPDARLVVAKQRSAHATCAIAREAS
jgi:cobalamin biosynthesis protein CbiG